MTGVAFSVLRRPLLPAVIAAVTAAPAAQTPITLHKNSATVQQDVQLGQQAAAEVRKEYPLLKDELVDSYVERLGRQLVAAIPPEFQEPAFTYTFEVVNLKDINAFALPGGPMFLNRGMLDAAKTDGEVVGVMAHEISHVVLRHGTAQQSKTAPALGSLGGQLLGAIVGGWAGSAISMGSQMTAGAFSLKYSREFEREADLMGARIMSRAGYDPRQMADMFKTIQQESKSSGPEWLSSHPDPGNRYEAINREAASLTIATGESPLHELNDVHTRLAKLSPPLTAEQAAKYAEQQHRAGARTVSTRVEPPSSTFRTYQAGNFMRISVPDNWEQLGSGGNSVTYAPAGGHVQTADGHSAFTHGVQIGLIGASGGSLRQNTDQLLQNFARSNPGLQRQGGYSSTSIGGRSALTTTLLNVSDATGQPEAISLSTVQLSNGNVLYLIGVTPRDEAGPYGQAFAQIRQSIRFSDPR